MTALVEYTLDAVELIVTHEHNHSLLLHLMMMLMVGLLGWLLLLTMMTTRSHHHLYGQVSLLQPFQHQQLYTHDQTNDPNFIRRSE
jgi:hypothetical protein